MKIAICDDEKNLAGIIGRLDSGVVFEKWKQLYAVSFSSGEAFLTSLEQKDYDLVILDIQMPGADGMEIARRLRMTEHDVGILFVTGYDEYLVQGYEVEAFRYLLKPVQKEKLWDALDRYVQRMRGKQKFWMVETTGGNKCIRNQEVLYVEAFAHNCELHTTRECMTTKCSISVLEKQAQENGIPFLRCHRSYSVNIAMVVEIRREEVLLSDGSRVPVSRRMYPELNQAFIHYYRKESGR